jgi:hypothetical protein
LEHRLRASKKIQGSLLTTGAQTQPPPPVAPTPDDARRIRRLMLYFGMVYAVEGIGQTDGIIAQPLTYYFAIASQADEAVEVVDAALDHSSHRDRAGGRRITVSTSEELQKTVDELTGTPGRPSRSNGGQHHAVVTPRVEVSPDRSDFAKLGETKQFADDIRSQVARRELAEMNERLMAFGDYEYLAHGACDRTQRTGGEGFCTPLVG